MDGALRQIPKYDRPHCRLLRALHGHPEAGALWEAKLDDIMKNNGWLFILENVFVYVHAKSKAAMVVYVYDMLLLSSPKDTDALWRDLEKKASTARIRRHLFSDTLELFIISMFLRPTSQKRPAVC